MVASSAAITSRMDASASLPDGSCALSGQSAAAWPTRQTASKITAIHAIATHLFDLNTALFSSAIYRAATAPAGGRPLPPDGGEFHALWPVRT